MLLENNWADVSLEKQTCGLLSGFYIERPESEESPLLISNVIQSVPGVFGSIESFSFALGASRCEASSCLHELPKPNEQSIALPRVRLVQ